MSTFKFENIFGQVKLGYVIAQSQKFDDWVCFMQKCLGLHLAEHTEQQLSFRIDDYQKRFIVQRGDAEDVTHIGFQVENQQVLDQILWRFDFRGIQYIQGSVEDAGNRGVKSFWALKGPKEIQVELFIDEVRVDQPLNMLASGFYTADSGMGHVAITSRKPEKMIRFWQEFFDARLTDTIEQKINGVTLDVTFLRLNERHHSIAVAETRGVHLDPIRTAIQHMNLQVLDLEDVTMAYQRCKDHGFPVAWEVGQHTNDREVSFYVASPSGFEIELGWAPIKIDEASWQPVKHTSISVWGHHPKAPTKAHKLMHDLDQLTRGLSSLRQDEYSPID